MISSIPVLKKILSINFKRVINLTGKCNMSTNLNEIKVPVKGVEINYLMVGKGSHPVLCLPGACGSIWTDFKPQVEKLNREKFTIIAWDPPGYGKSRPPDKIFPLNFYHEDAAMAVELMKVLKIDKYSLLGWSDGGICSMIMAAENPEQINKMVIWGSNAYVVKSEVDMVQGIRDVNKWSAHMREPMEQVYGKEYFSVLWSRWVDAYSAVYEKNNGDICKSLAPKIKCPTLILHGKKDPVVAPEHHTWLLNNIKGSQLKVFEEGKHNIHLRYADEFNQIVEQFLENNS